MVQTMSIEVRLLFERDLIGLEGLWSHHDLPCSHSIPMTGDTDSEHLWHQVEVLLRVPYKHIALFFFLAEDSEDSQESFYFLPPNEPLSWCLEGAFGPRTHLTVLCLASEGYDPFTSKWLFKHRKPDELFKWNDDDLSMLIVT